MTVHASVIYSGWLLDEETREISPVETRTAALYPARLFAARDATSRELKAGPYAAEADFAALD